MFLLIFAIALSGLAACGTATATYDEVLNSDVSATKPAKAKKVTLVNPVNVETQAEIIIVSLNEMTTEDHAVTASGDVYLLVSDELYKVLPKSVNEIKVNQYTGSAGIRQDSVPYIVFSRWGEADGSIYVTKTAYFVGGNTGGCSKKYEKNDAGQWTRTKSDCFAAAS